MRAARGVPLSRRFRPVLLLLGLGFGAVRVVAQPIPPPDVSPFQERAAILFDSRSLISESSRFVEGCDRLLLIAQAVSVLVVVGALLVRMQRDQAQMESIASMLLKVAFIATVPFWRTFILESGEAVAAALDFRRSAGGQNGVMVQLWRLLQQWAPPGSPFLDALQTQSASNIPASGGEEEWMLQAWNWARGLGSASASSFSESWQAFSGGLRAFLVLSCCTAMACCTVFTIVIGYLAEVLRCFIVLAGCSLLPVFIAGIGSDALRPSSVRFVFTLVSVAFWPAVWSLTGMVTQLLLEGAGNWMTDVAAAAAGVNVAGQAVPSLGTIAPYLGWWTLSLFAATCFALCLWCAGSYLLAPFLMGKFVAAGATVVLGSPGGASSPGSSPVPTGSAFRERVAGAGARAGGGGSVVVHSPAVLAESGARATEVTRRLAPVAPPPTSVVMAGSRAVADWRVAPLTGRAEPPPVAPWLEHASRSKAR